MKGIIMAGGEGTRLRPLTCDCPKPMIRLMDRPVMQYAIELLRRHGVTDIAATLAYLPDTITDAFADGADLGVGLRCYVEQKPLGTAGGVRQAADFLDETFIVLSGDGVTDLDITRAAAFHRACGALATLVLRRVENPLDYGVVDTDADGRVLSFHEKPDWADVTSDTVNTGIYILEPELLRRIPENTPCDFGHELFPRLVAEGAPVYGYITDDYWCDVGDVRAYLGAHIDAMEGRVRLEGLPPMNGQAVVLPGAVVDRSAVLEGPCLVAAGAEIGPGVYVGPYSVVGEGCRIGEGASVKRAVLWPGARLLPQAQARGCVLGPGAVLGEGAQAYEESVLGSRARVGARGMLLPGVKLWPGKQVADGERLDANRVWGSRPDAEFLGGALPTNTPAEAARAAQACAAAFAPREVLIGHDGSARGAALWHAACAGVMAQGAAAMDAGACTLPMLRFAQASCRADLALLIGDGTVTPLNAVGAPPDIRQRRAVLALNARQDFPFSPTSTPAPVLRAECAFNACVGDLAARFTADPAKAPRLLVRSEGIQARLAEMTLNRAGLRFHRIGPAAPLDPEENELGVDLPTDGAGCTLTDARGSLTEAQRQLMIAWLTLRDGERLLLLPMGATRGIDTLAARYGASTETIPGEPARWLNVMAQRAPGQLRLHTDGLYLTLRALSALAEDGMRLSKWRRAMPEVHRRSRALAVPARMSGQVLSAFAKGQSDAQLGGGVRIDRDDGWVWVGADSAAKRLRVVAEGKTAEIAAELCDFCEAEIRRLAGSEGMKN